MSGSVFLRKGINEHLCIKDLPVVPKVRMEFYDMKLSKKYAIEKCRKRTVR